MAKQNGVRSRQKGAKERFRETRDEATTLQKLRSDFTPQTSAVHSSDESLQWSEFTPKVSVVHSPDGSLPIVVVVSLLSLIHI